MKNLDAIQKAKAEFAKQLRQAFENKDEAAMTAAFDKYADGIQQALMETAAEIGQTADSTILTKRGIRQLTSAEQKFYNNLAEAMANDDPKHALAGVDVTIPQTVIDTVLDDIEVNHPLLTALDIKNTYGKLKWIFADDPKQMAVWGKITSAIQEELEGSLHDKDFSTNKLSAFIPIPKDMLDLGASYLDTYVRRILADALAYGLEYGFISGTGKDMPIGMIKDLEAPVTAGEYKDKEAIKVTSFAIDKYCDLVAKLATKSGGKTRAVNGVCLICNPVDYIKKVVPGSTMLCPDGKYSRDNFPFPTTPYQSEMIKEGTALMGILPNYMACLSTGKDGKVEYSDQYRFLEDERVYIIKLFAFGAAKDNNDFINLDISELEPLELSVILKNQTSAD